VGVGMEGKGESEGEEESEGRVTEAVGGGEGRGVVEVVGLEAAAAPRWRRQRLATPRRPGRPSSNPAEEERKGKQRDTETLDPGPKKGPCRRLGGRGEVARWRPCWEHHHPAWEEPKQLSSWRPRNGRTR
jgi:hypothetical protein